ncbi:type IV pilus modification PilV family protein [Desulfuribacillus alkaliarsenatis]|uniref:Prepilin-type N-terminal cleavage/methylation domain-containing protein n=1 Tax=Desulfuribacillus alkaliarsenatis TaxID=766136 RepID=A0A1E5G5F9_9FIRM|nr:prepilin-type N-terminal cleavage/methylation domain-containing protein [Desulfuribacillus alkaliarsenatis]OEF98335.1 hypothetical protein BHF68_01250 [Desulfuribacillus alkaliarsenatis]
MGQRFKDTQGFSLMEVIVAMVIITIVGGAVVGVYHTTSRASASSKERLAAIIEAENQIEHLRANHGLVISGLDPESNAIGSSFTINNTYGHGYTTISLLNYDEDRRFALYQIVVQVESENIQPILLGGKLLVEY